MRGRLGVALLGGGPIPLQRLIRMRRCAHTAVVDKTQTVLRLGIALLGERPQIGKCLATRDGVRRQGSGQAQRQCEAEQARAPRAHGTGGLGPREPC